MSDQLNLFDDRPPSPSRRGPGCAHGVTADKGALEGCPECNYWALTDYLCYFTRSGPFPSTRKRPGMAWDEAGTKHPTLEQRRAAHAKLPPHDCRRWPA